MKLKKNIYYWQVICLALVLLGAISNQSWGDDKKKIPTSIPGKPAVPVKPPVKPSVPGKPKATPNPGHPEKSKVTTPTKKVDTSGPDSRKTPSETAKLADTMHQPKREPPFQTAKEGDKFLTRNKSNQVRVIERPGLKVQNHLHGGNTFIAEHNNRQIVGMGRNRGYMQRPFYKRNGHDYVQRTYVVNGRSYAVAYRSYGYRGVTYYTYAPAYYYHPAFYGWAYSPWAAPIAYNWGWAGNPWYAGYAYYFTPYPAYSSASLWLTDYLLAENLQAAYAAAAEAAASAQIASSDANGAGQVALSPEVKQMISDEVQRQLAADKLAASLSTQPQTGTNQVANEALPALEPAQKIFIVASNLDLVDDAGDECVVTPGDVLLRMGKEPDLNNRIAVSVESSKKGDCPVDTNSEVTVSDLQEMHNQFREKLDSGLKTLAANQGKNGLPAAPDTGTSGGEIAPPTPDSTAEAELQNQQKNADEMAQQVTRTGPAVASQNK
jgi:hypothetical protein